MSPEVLNLLDKVSFTTALLVAVYILYRDSRGDLEKSIQKNTESIAELVISVKQLTNLVTLMLDYEQRQTGDTKPLPALTPSQLEGGKSVSKV